MRKILFAVCLTALCVALLAPGSTAHYAKDPSGNGMNSESGGGYTGLWVAHSKHSGNHGSLCTGEDWANVIVIPPVAERCDSDVHLWNKKQSILRNTTPLGGTSKGSSAKKQGGTCTTGQTEGWARLVVGGKKGWSDKVYPGQGTLTAYYNGNVEVLKLTHKCAHIPIDPPKVESGTPTQIVQTFSDAGAPDYDENGDLQFDTNGEIVWTTPPATVVEFSSSISRSGTTVTYTYEIENLDSEDRTFSIPEVTGPGHASGWSGTVEGNDTETLSFSVTGKDVYRQTAQITLSIDEDLGGAYAHTSGVYVTDSRVTWSGDVTITSIQETAGDNEVNFQVSGDEADKAVLWRLENDVWLVVDELEQSFTSGSTYTLTDESPPTGSNSYRVQVGVAPNAAASDVSTIQN